MTLGKPAKLICLFAIPIFLEHLFQRLYNIVDSVIIGQLMDVNLLAAVGTSSPVITMFISITVGIGVGVTVVIAQLFGAHRYGELKRAASTMFIWIMAISIIVSILGLVFCYEIMAMIKVPSTIISATKEYLSIVFTGFIFVAASSFFVGLFRGIGDAKTPLFILAVSTFVNIILDIVFVMHLGMGISGVAIATIISQALAAITCAIYVYKKVPVLRIGIKEFKYDTILARESFRFAIPSAVQQAVASIGMLLIQGLVNSFGTIFIATHIYAERIHLFASLPISSICIALSAFTAQNIGCGNIARVEQGLRSVNKILTILSASIFIIIPFAAQPLLELMVTDGNESVIYQSKLYVTALGFTYIFYALMNTHISVLKSVGDDKASSIIALLGGLILREPLAYLLCYIPEIGSAGIWLSLSISWIIASIIAVLRYNSRKWLDHDFVHHEAKIFAEYKAHHKTKDV